MAIGLDVGSSAVRAVQLDKRRGAAVRLRRFGEVALPPGAVVDGDVVEADAVAQAVKRLWAEAGLRSRQVAVGVASQRVTVRPMDLPELAEAELADAVRLQAHDELPIPVEEAVLGHVVVERYDVGDGRRNVRLLLVAAERDMVDRLLAAVSRAKLRVALVDLGAFALLRSVVRSLPAGDEAELVVDVGAAVTKIAVHRGGAPLFVRMVRLGGDTVTHQLQDALDLSWEEAERAKLDASAAMATGAHLGAEDERVRVLEAGTRRVVSEIRHSLEFFRSQHEVEVRRVLLSGGASLTANLDAQLESVLDVAVEKGDPLRGLDAAVGSGNGAPLGDKWPFLAVPVGLAMGLLR